MQDLLVAIAMDDVIIGYIMIIAISDNDGMAIILYVHM